jgi:hypothetical protein
MKQFWLVAGAALILVSLLPDEAFAQHRGGGFGGGFRGGAMGGGFRGGGVGMGRVGAVGGGFRGAAIGGGLRGGGPGIARIGTIGGGFRGGSIGAARVGGFGGRVVRGPVFVGRSALIGRSAFVGRPFVNRAFVPGRRFAFFPRRRFIAPFFGAGLFAAGYGYSSCWSWVPTAFGWQQIWVCGGPYGYGYGDYY